MFLKNSWYVAAIGSELLAGQVLSRTICEVPMALYRDEAGRVGALFDRCPHRAYPLSAGAVTMEGLECSYHGLVFGPDGKCTKIPSQSDIPTNARVIGYPVREAHGFIWIWPGPPERAEQTPLPGFEAGDGYLRGLDFSCLTDHDNWGVAGPEVIHVDANYMLVVDNLMDLTHGAFVHRKTFGPVDNILASERTIKPVGEVIEDFFAIRGPLPKPLQMAYGLGEEEHDSFLETRWTSPSVMILVHGATPTGRGREEGTVLLNTNIITPATATTSHYFWAQSVWKNKANGAIRDIWGPLTKMVFSEDEVTLRNQQANLVRLGSDELADNLTLVLRADRGVTMARGIVKRRLRAEQASTAAA